MSITISHIICFILGLFIESVLTSSMINGRLSITFSKLKFKRKNGRDQYIFGPYEKDDFAALIYALNEIIYGEAVSEIDKEY